MEAFYFVLYILLAIVILLLMVVIHELGHYLAGKLFKFKINEFSVGFGPKLLQRTSKKTGEKFTLRLIPLGGYCAFEDEDGMAEVRAQKPEDPFLMETAPIADAQPAEKPRPFLEEKAYKRAIVLAAGGIFNIVSAVFFSFIFIWAAGYQAPQIGEIFEIPGTEIAYNTEIAKGDIILSVDGQRVDVMHDYSGLLAACEVGKTYPFTVLRNGVETEIQMKKQTYQYLDDSKNWVTAEGFGFRIGAIVAINGSFTDAVKYSVPFTAKLAWTIIGSFGQMFTGEVKVTDMSGPVGTVTAMAEISQMNWRNIFLLLPLIAANLGIFNLFPIPALDGSKIVFIGIYGAIGAIFKKKKGRPISKKGIEKMRAVESYVHLIGLFALLAFVVVIDILGFIL